MSIEGTTPRAERSSTPKWVLPAATFAVGILVGVGGAVATLTAVNAVQSIPGPSPLAAAAEACSLHEEVGAVKDDGNTLIFEMRGKDDTTGGVTSELWCVLKQLEAPQSVKALMGDTTSLQGRQTETWNNIKATWTYHPDSGLDTIFTLVND